MCKKLAPWNSHSAAGVADRLCSTINPANSHDKEKNVSKEGAKVSKTVRTENLLKPMKTKLYKDNIANALTL